MDRIIAPVKTISDFLTFLTQNIEKIEGGPFEVIKTFKKKVAMPKKN